MRLSLIVHPWRIEDSKPQSSEQVERLLEAEIEAIEHVMETTGAWHRLSRAAKTD